MKLYKKVTLSLSLVSAFALSSLSASELIQGGPVPITHQDLKEAQQTWIDGLLAISAAHQEGGDYRALAAEMIDSQYNYAFAPVLFKPTLAHGEQTFRTSSEGALAYFVGSNPDFPDDSGFALKGWESVDPKNVVFFIDGGLGLTMGHFTFVNGEGTEVTVEKTFGFRRGDDGQLRIALHKSTIPFSPAGA